MTDPHQPEHDAESGNPDGDVRSRRQLLRLAGAAAAGGAGLALASSSTASADTGGNFILGQANDADVLTRLNLDGGIGSLAVGVENLTGNITAIQANGSLADVKLTGTGRLGMTSQITGLAQPTGGSGLNELVKANGGRILWSDSDGGWRRINAVRVDNPNGNGTAFAPFRLVNTINGTGGESGKRSVNTNTTYDAAGHANLPDDTIAIFGNLAVVDPDYNNGFIKLFPAGVAEPTTSAINFNAGQTIANFFFLGLGTGANAGDFVVRPGRSAGGTSGNVHVVIDITGYVQ